MKYVLQFSCPLSIVLKGTQNGVSIERKEEREKMGELIFSTEKGSSVGYDLQLERFLLHPLPFLFRI